MHKTIPWLCSFALLLMIGCKKAKNDTKSTASSTDTVPVDPAHNSRNSLDWAGTYTGELPCEDCPVLKTTLILHSDLTYELKQKQADKDEANKEKGAFTWDDQGASIHLQRRDTLDELSFQVGENQLLPLSLNDDDTKTSTDENFTLHKTMETTP